MVKYFLITFFSYEQIENYFVKALDKQKSSLYNVIVK